METEVRFARAHAAAVYKPIAEVAFLYAGPGHDKVASLLDHLPKPGETGGCEQSMRLVIEAAGRTFWGFMTDVDLHSVVALGRGRSPGRPNLYRFMFVEVSEELALVDEAFFGLMLEQRVTSVEVLPITCMLLVREGT